MKYLLILFPFFAFAQVNVSTYGAVGDGVTNDAAAIQAAFDSGNDIVFTAGRSYRIASGLELDQAGDQNIEGNGAFIIANGAWVNDFMLQVNKPSGVTSINNLTFDANQDFRHGIELRSSFSLDGVFVTRVHAPQGQPFGVLGISIPNFGAVAFTQAYMNNVSVVDVDSYPDGVIANGIAGVAKGLQVQIANTTFNNNLIVENSLFAEVYGDDADAVDLFIIDGHPEFTGSVTFNNVTVRDATRRVMKSRISRSTFNNCTFSAVQATNPRLYPGTFDNSIIAHFNFGTDPDPLRDVTYNNCTFNGSTYENLVLIYETQDITFQSCDFNRVTLAWTEYWGDTFLYDNNFDINSRIFSYNVTNGWLPGSGLADCNNVKASANWDQLTERDFVVLPCPPPGTPPPSGGGGSTTTPNALKNETSAMLISH